MTVTSLPKAENADANSIPITPAPIIDSLRGILFIDSISVDVTIFCSPTFCFVISSSFKKGGVLERDPEAMIIFLASICLPLLQ